MDGHVVLHSLATIERSDQLMSPSSTCGPSKASTSAISSATRPVGNGCISLISASSFTTQACAVFNSISVAPVASRSAASVSLVGPRTVPAIRLTSALHERVAPSLEGLSTPGHTARGAAHREQFPVSDVPFSGWPRDRYPPRSRAPPKPRGHPPASRRSPGSRPRLAVSRIRAPTAKRRAMRPALH